MEGGTVKTDRSVNVFREVLELTKAKKVFEIGFNQGVSSEIFLEAGVSLHSVDIDKKCEKLMQSMKGDFTYEIKSSTLLKAENYENFDLLFVDGGHTLSNLLNDLRFGVALGVPYILVDDYVSTGQLGYIRGVVDGSLKSMTYEVVEVYTYDATAGENKMALLKHV